MYERYYGFDEKPFSLTPDPKYLYRSQSHANAFDLLQYAIDRREGFVVITGDIGTGKTTLCRALLGQIDRKTVTALVLNPFLSEEDLLKRILVDFGVISRDDLKSGRLAGVGKQELVDALYEFLLGLIPLNASAVLIIDEAQNLPLPVLEQIRILSNLETDKEKLLQIILVGQLNLQTLLRAPEMRQLDQRISIRYELKPLDEDAVAAYVSHRLAIAGGSTVSFTAKALRKVHRLSAGIPRLINLICDRALLSGFSLRTNRILPEIVVHAAESLDLAPQSTPQRGWLRRRASLFTAAAVVLLAATLAVGITGYLYRRFASGVERVAEQRLAALGVSARGSAAADAGFTILAASFAASSPTAHADVESLTAWLQTSGFRVYHSDVDLGLRGRWQRVLAGAYTDREAARRDALKLKAAYPGIAPRVVGAGLAAGRVATVSNDIDLAATLAGTEP